MNSSRLFRVFDSIFGFLASLKLAVLVILALAAALAAGTIVESLTDTASAQYWVYRSFWFYGLLVLLGVNIFAVAVSRLPWKKSHAPFLIAHLGILILLAGSWITFRAGVEGTLRISEGESGKVVDLDTQALFLSEKEKIYSVAIPWAPSSVKFQPFSVSSRGIPFEVQVDQYLTHADPQVSFIANPEPRHSPSHDKPKAALQLLIQGGVMKITQEVWLWEGDPSWSKVQAGPATFALNQKAIGRPGQPGLEWFQSANGDLRYRAVSSSGKVKSGVLKKDQIPGSVMDPGWKGEVKITVLQWIPDAVAQTVYQPSRIQAGPQAPSSALHVSTTHGVGIWLGLGDRAVLHLGDREVLIGYLPHRVLLPFSVRLEEFKIDHNEGTLTPAAYSSRVSVLNGESPQEVTISMNHPLELGGYTLYQASYEEASPRPTTSIFAVNRDPGRPWKYVGSLLIVLGSVFLFVAKVRKKKKTAVAVLKPTVSWASGAEVESRC